MYRFLTAIILISICFRVESQDITPDIRKVVWGMSKAEVKNAEELEVAYETEDLLGYESSVGGLDAYLYFGFVENKLYRLVYVFQEKHSNRNMYVDDFQKLSNALYEKYGDWESDSDWVWENDLYVDDPEEMGLAISVGHVWRAVLWNTPRTKIGHEIKGDNFEITHRIMYDSIEFMPLADEARKKSIQDDI